MQIVSSYGVEIKQKNIPLCSTLDIFRKAVSYLIPVYAETWKELSEIRNLQKRFNEAEHLVHETKKNHARFAIDRQFPKMPSNLRRAAIQHALGAVSSYQTRLGLWEKGDLKGKPKLVCENHAMPVFYRDVMYREAEPGEDVAHLKLFDGREWKWFQVKLLHTDMEYLRKKWSGKKASAPTLEKSLHKVFLESRKNHEQMNELFGYETGLHYHTEILEAFKNHDAERARDVMEQHLGGSIETLKMSGKIEDREGGTGKK